MLIAGLAAPLVAAALVAAAPRVRNGGDIVRAVAAAGAAVWAAVLATGGTEELGRFTARPVAAAAACGAALLVAATRPVERGPRDVAALVAVWAATTFGVAAGLGDPSTIPVVLALLAGAAVLALVSDDGRALPAVLVTAGASLAVAGFAVAGEETAGFAASAFAGSPVGATLALAGAACVLAAALWGDGPTVVALPALAVAVVVAPQVGTPAAAVLPFAAAAMAAAWFDRRALAIALLAVAGLATATTGGLLLAAAAVVVTAVPSAPALLAALPGVSVLAQRAALDPSVASVALAVAAGVTALLLTVGRDLRPAAIPLRSLPAAAAGAALVVAPGSWGWARPGGALDHWDRGAAVALAAALLVAAVAALTDTLPLPAAVHAHDAETDAEPAPDDPRWAARAGIVALVALGLATAALVRSALRSV